MMKKVLVCLLAAILLLTAVPVLAEEDEMLPDSPGGLYTYMYVYTRNGLPLHMRSQPSRQAAVVADIPYGSRIRIIYEENLTWAYAEYGNAVGFVMQDYLVPNKPSPSGGGSTPSGGTTPTTVGDMGTMNQELKTLRLVRSYTIYSSPVRSSGFVNLRYAPHTLAEIATICYDGHALNVIAETRNWYQVEDPTTGYIGYIMRQYTRTRR